MRPGNDAKVSPGAGFTDQGPGGPMKKQDRISVVFAGGGCRTFWGLGLYSGLKGALPSVAEWSGTSAGSAMATVAAAGLEHETVESFAAITASNPRNFYPGKIFLGDRPFPHNEIYRRAVQGILEKGGWAALRKAAPVRIFLAFVKKDHPPVSTWLKAVWNYERGKLTRVHGPDETFPGLGCRVVTAQEAQNASEVVDWILSASSTPPLTDIRRYDGQPYVDGGLVDNVPVRALSEEGQGGKVVVILSRPTPEDIVPPAPNRLYLAPSVEVPVKKWDYTSPAKIRATFELGLSDAKRYRDRLDSFLN